MKHPTCENFELLKKIPLGCFTDEVKDFAGQYIKDADKGIIAKLKSEGRLVQSGTLTHR